MSDRDYFREQWLRANDFDEPETKLPWPCPSCRYQRWAEVTCVRCGYGSTVWSEDDELELSRIFSEQDSERAKW